MAAGVRHFRHAKHRMRTPAAAIFAALGLTLSACGSPGSALVAATETATATPSPSQSRTPAPTPKPISKTPCTSEATQQIQAGTTFVCTADDAGKLVWLAAAEAKALLDKRAAVAAAEKVAADKAAAEKAAADKIAADKVAAEQAAVEQAAAQAAADQAAAEQAARDAAAKQVAPPQAVVPPPASNCDPNYSGACVPIASDVDCAGGSGNGPAYVRGPAYVVGSDIYGLDGNDNDGIGCEG